MFFLWDNNKFINNQDDRITTMAGLKTKNQSIIGSKFVAPSTHPYLLFKTNKGTQSLRVHIKVSKDRSRGAQSPYAYSVKIQCSKKAQVFQDVAEMRTKILNMVKECSLDRQCSRVLSSIAKNLEKEELTLVKIQDFVSKVIGNPRKTGEEIVTKPGGEDIEIKQKVDDLKSGPDEDEAEGDDGGSGFSNYDYSENTVGPT
ncbi:hypothetical protein U1Q18_003295 [Sarracenia purpurea var. burkii]